ncbi:MAG: Rab family GTPase [Promethearchaeota archaeon]
MSDYDYIYKVLLVGEPSGSKYRLGKRYLTGGFTGDFQTTLGLNLYTKAVESYGNILKLQIWDIGEKGVFKSLFENYCKGAKAAFILYDITDSQELQRLPVWIQIVRKNAGNIPILLVGCKIELEEIRQVSLEDISSITERYNIEFYEEISTRTGYNVEGIFEMMGNVLIETYSPKEINKTSGRIKTEFRVNEFLTLKLQNNRINIYVKEKLFDQCKYLLLNIPFGNIEDYDEIESIDEAAEKLDKSMEGFNRINSDIPIEAEFWGHCSNIQAWYENDYDTRIMHRNLAFPLLKALVDAGDPLAKKVFKEEIALRLESGYPSVVRYLINQGYLNYLSKDELEIIIENPKFLENLSHYSSNYRDLPRWLLKMIRDFKKEKSSFKLFKRYYDEIPVLE